MGILRLRTANKTWVEISRSAAAPTASGLLKLKRADESWDQHVAPTVASAAPARLKTRNGWDTALFFGKLKVPGEWWYGPITVNRSSNGVCWTVTYSQSKSGSNPVTTQTTAMDNTSQTDVGAVFANSSSLVTLQRSFLTSPGTWFWNYSEQVAWMPIDLDYIRRHIDDNLNGPPVTSATIDFMMQGLVTPSIGVVGGSVNGTNVHVYLTSAPIRTVPLEGSTTGETVTGVYQAPFSHGTGSQVHSADLSTMPWGPTAGRTTWTYDFLSALNNPNVANLIFQFVTDSVPVPEYSYPAVTFPTSDISPTYNRFTVYAAGSALQFSCTALIKLEAP